MEDIVKTNLYFLDHPELSGIYNLGTGRSQPFNDLAAATVNACRAAEGKHKLSLEQLVEQQLIRYIPFPEDLVGKDQSFTQADTSKLRAAGYAGDFYTVELIRYTPFPDALKGKYQSFTQADTAQLRQAGYTADFYTVEQGVSRYVEWLLTHSE